MTVTTSQLTSYGYQARDEHAILGSLDLDGQNVRGCCIDISSYIIDKLYNRTTLSEEDFDKVRCKFKGEELHYFVRVNMSCVEDCNGDTGYLFVDAALDQFCTEQKQFDRVDVEVGQYKDLERVAFIPPEDSRRNWYKNCVTGV